MIKAVIFDYGGVLKDGTPLPVEISEAFNISLEELDKLKDKTVPLFKLLNSGLIDEENFWHKIAEAIEKPLPSDCIRLGREIYRKRFSLNTKLLAFAKLIKSKGFKIAVLSNIAEFQAEIIRENGGYDDFNPVVLSYEEKVNKPDLAIYLSALERIKLKPNECIFIDDKERNLLPARDLGMQTILAQSTEQIIKDVSATIHI